MREFLQGHRFDRFAWGVLAYTVLVIVWGGFVRASGSGAGCGDHWPLCNGEVVPRTPALNTMIEFAHRVTSGLALPLALGLFVWAWLVYPRRSAVRVGAAAGLFFMVTEALIGAGLVLLEYVAYNVSVARGYWMAAHLGNTFLLLAALALTAWWASGGHVPQVRGVGRRGAAALAALAGTFVLGISGAVTALGDTLAIGGGIDPQSDPVVGALVALRVVHPTLACAVLGLVAWAAWSGRDEARARRLGLGVLALFGVQMLIGLVNVRWMAPIPLQLVHLFVTDLIWVGLVLFAAEALPRRASAPRPALVAA